MKKIIITIFILLSLCSCQEKSIIEQCNEELLQSKIKITQLELKIAELKAGIPECHR